MSRTLTLAAAALLASAVAAAAADSNPIRFTPSAPPAPTWDGYVSAGMGQLTGSLALGAGNSLGRTQGRGSVATMIAPEFGVQIDAQGDLISTTGTSIATLNLAGHVYSRNANRLLGAFAQYRGLGAGSTDGTVYFEGAELQWYAQAAPLSLYARAAAEQITGTGLGGTGNGYNVLGQLRVFANPNWRFDLNIGYDSVNISGSVIGSTWLGAGTEFRFNNPLSVFAQYTYVAINAAGTSANLSLWMLGAKWSVGTNTLVQRDRNGASLDPVQGILAFIP